MTRRQTPRVIMVTAAAASPMPAACERLARSPSSADANATVLAG